MRAMLSIEPVQIPLWCCAALLALVSLLAVSSPALAGGLGAFNGTGFHFGEALGEGAETGSWMNEGGGVELVLGPRDVRLNGRLRFAYNAIIDLGERGDSGSEASSAQVRHSGVMSVGAMVGLLPEVAEKFGLYLAVDLGISPLVQNMQFYFFADLGPGVRFHVTDRLTLFAELAGLFRYDTSFSGGVLMSLGARFPFE